jgi:ribonuclease Z|tara:strand:+ start:402 stop:1472 length:1071 start_codon:yes stop_codon:yes gene_type:complete
MKKRTVLAALIIIVSLAIYSQRGDIALRILPAAMEANLSTNKIEELGDGLHIGLCGAGGPMPAATRSGPCVVVVAAGKLFMLDAGSNGIRNMGRMGFDIGQIEGVFLTHFHSDHIDGLGEVATLRWAGGGHNSPLNIYGPEGVADIVSGFNSAYQRDSVYRNDHHGDAATPLSGAGMTAVSFPQPENGVLTTVYQQDGLTVEMLSVNHFPITPAVAYLFTYKGRTSLVSGDTNKSANLQQFAKGIDLLVHEALSTTMVNAMGSGALASGNLSLAKIFGDIHDYHATPTEAAEIARDAEVGHLLYYHVVPPLVIPGSEAAWLEGVDDIFQDYTLGQDGVLFSLPANSTDIIEVEAKL